MLQQPNFRRRSPDKGTLQASANLSRRRQSALRAKPPPSSYNNHPTPPPPQRPKRRRSRTTALLNPSPHATDPTRRNASGHAARRRLRARPVQAQPARPRLPPGRLPRHHGRHHDLRLLAHRPGHPGAQVRHAHPRICSPPPRNARTHPMDEGRWKLESSEELVELWMRIHLADFLAFVLCGV